MMKQPLNQMAHKILDAAEYFTQTRGFNAFSYKDLQKEVGVKTSSIHYYFPTKQDLAVNMAKRYVERFTDSLRDLDAQGMSSIEKLKAMAEPFLASAKEEKFCLCGMLASDIMAMPEAASEFLHEFFCTSEDWIAKVLRQGIKDKDIRKKVHPESAAAHFLAALEGGLLIARTRKDAVYMQAVLDNALAQLKG